jgi:hypothetical protein
MQGKILAPGYNRLFSPSNNNHGYANSLQLHKLRTLHDRIHRINPILFINVLLFRVGSTVSPFIYSSLFPISVQVYRPLSPGGKPFAVNKYHILSIFHWDIRDFPCFTLVHPSKTVPPPDV